MFCGILVAKQDLTVNGVGGSFASFLRAEILLLTAVNCKYGIVVASSDILLLTAVNCKYGIVVASSDLCS
jgi:hypothetical protein